MGTSSSNSGLKGKVPLLPNWALGPEGDTEAPPDGDNQNDTEDNTNDQNPQNDPDSNETKEWNSAKRSVTRFVNSKGKKSAKEAAKNYVRTYGGSKKATKASYSGISSGLALAGFLSGFAASGYEQNLKNYHLGECIGKSSEEVLAKIADEIAPIGSTSDEAIARSAVMDTLDKIYEKLLNEGKDIEALGTLDESNLKEMVMEFISAYIFKKWMYELGLKVEKNELSEKDVVKKENEMRVLIKSEVEVALRDKNIQTFNVTEGEGKKIIEEIFELAYSTLGK